MKLVQLNTKWSLCLIGFCCFSLHLFGQSKRAMRERAMAKPEVALVGERLKKDWVKLTKARLGLYYRQRTLTHNGVTMPLWWVTYGEKPADGYSLFIPLLVVRLLSRTTAPMQ